VPIVAPVAGGLLALITNWRGMFGVLAVLALLLTGLAWRVLPETLPPPQRTPPHLGAVLRNLGSLLRLRAFVAYVGVVSAASGMLFGYIGASSFVLQGAFGLTPQQYSLVFAINSVGIFVASNLTRRLVTRVSARRLVVVGQSMAIAGAGALALGTGVHQLAIVMIGLLLAISTIGLIMPSTMGLGMAVAGNRAGAASGVFGICQFTVGAAASPLAGLGGSPWSLVAVMGTCVLAGPILLRVLTPSPSPVQGAT
jgi:DHA1 family bicyclomycin/chloramphenicol resistance-like MFS transporter